MKLNKKNQNPSLINNNPISNQFTGNSTSLKFPPQNPINKLSSTGISITNFNQSGLSAIPPAKSSIPNFNLLGSTNPPTLGTTIPHFNLSGSTNPPANYSIPNFNSSGSMNHPTSGPKIPHLTTRNLSVPSNSGTGNQTLSITNISIPLLPVMFQIHLIQMLIKNFLQIQQLL
jgi:hypothetical protein